MTVNGYKHLRVRDDDALGQKMAREFERQAKAAGWSQGQVDNVIRTVATNEFVYAAMPVEEAWQDFETKNSHLLTEDNFDFSAGWLDNFVTHGVDAMEPRAAERFSRLRELDEMSKQADGEYYTGSEAQALQREHLLLLQGDDGVADMGEFEQAASEAAETLDSDYSDNAFDNNAADGAADYGDDNGF